MSFLDSEFDRVTGIWRMLGKKWTVPVLQSISARGVARFGELKRAVGVSGTMLSETLMELEREGLVTKNTVPPNVEYGLTDSAKTLYAILEELGRWSGRRNLQAQLVSSA